MCNSLCIITWNTLSFKVKVGEVFSKTLLKCNYFWLTSLKMQAVHFNLHCRIAHFMRAYIWYGILSASLESMGGLCYPECWWGKMQALRSAVQEQPVVVVQEKCSAPMASQVLLMTCWILVAFAVLLHCCRTFRSAPAWESFLGWA